LVNLGHQVFIQYNAGEAIGFNDDLYESFVAKILQTTSDIYNSSELIIRVKELIE